MHIICTDISLPPILIMSMLLVYIYQCVYITAHYSIRMSYSLKLVVWLGSTQALVHSVSGVMCESPSSFTAADVSPPGGDSRRAGRREGMKHLMHALPV